MHRYGQLAWANFDRIRPCHLTSFAKSACQAQQIGNHISLKGRKGKEEREKERKTKKKTQKSNILGKEKTKVVEKRYEKSCRHLTYEIKSRSNIRFYILCIVPYIHWRFACINRFCYIILEPWVFKLDQEKQSKLLRNVKTIFDCSIIIKNWRVGFLFICKMISNLRCCAARKIGKHFMEALLVGSGRLRAPSVNQIGDHRHVDFLLF